MQWEKAQEVAKLFQNSEAPGTFKIISVTDKMLLSGLSFNKVDKHCGEWQLGDGNSPLVGEISCKNGKYYSYDC